MDYTSNSTHEGQRDSHTGDDRANVNGGVRGDRTSSGRLLNPIPHPERKAVRSRGDRCHSGRLQKPGNTPGPGMTKARGDRGSKKVAEIRPLVRRVTGDVLTPVIPAEAMEARGMYAPNPRQHQHRREDHYHHRHHQHHHEHHNDYQPSWLKLGTFFPRPRC